MEEFVGIKVARVEPHQDGAADSQGLQVKQPHGGPQAELAPVN